MGLFHIKKYSVNIPVEIHLREMLCEDMHRNQLQLARVLAHLALVLLRVVVVVHVRLGHSHALLLAEE